MPTKKARRPKRLYVIFAEDDSASFYNRLPKIQISQRFVQAGSKGKFRPVRGTKSVTLLGRCIGRVCRSVVTATGFNPKAGTVYRVEVTFREVK